jgi:predicted DNA-binding protein (UPF0251 family)/predicted Fe-Mo cluster-binding NifX family protein
MSRPFKCRCVAFVPNVTYFKPAGVPLKSLKEVRLSVEEVEALRLKEIEGLDQEEGAVRMSISRPTFQRILTSARHKVADALLTGKAIRIEGGNFQVLPPLINFKLKSELINSAGDTRLMKIAVVTDDGITVSQHFGRAQYYTVVTVDNGEVVSKEQRNKAGHHVAGAEHASQASQGEKHGYDANAQASHAGMMANITDCQLLIAGGMGWGAQESLKQAGIAVHMTDMENIEEAVKLYLQGKLANKVERLH